MYLLTIKNWHYFIFDLLLPIRAEIVMLESNKAKLKERIETEVVPSYSWLLLF